MNLTIPDYKPGDRIPRSDYAARSKHDKESSEACMIVGCDKSSAECQEHEQTYRVGSANDAYETAKYQAIAYCWGRADAGDATAHPQDVWWVFSELWGRAKFNFVLEKRVSTPSLQRAWEKFINEEEI